MATRTGLFRCALPMARRGPLVICPTATARTRKNEWKFLAEARWLCWKTFGGWNWFGMERSKLSARTLAKTKDIEQSWKLSPQQFVAEEKFPSHLKRLYRP